MQYEAYFASYEWASIANISFIFFDADKSWLVKYAVTCSDKA